MKRPAMVITGLILLVAVSLAFISADVPRYKNLKILKKDISKEELDSVMHFFSMSLGEKCGFCHVRNEAAQTMDFASDANPQKNIARYMMRMNAKITKKYFKSKEQNAEAAVQAVTCYTCHHGQAEPAVKASEMRHDGMGPPPGNMGNFPRDSMRNAGRDSLRNMSGDSTQGQHQ